MLFVLTTAAKQWIQDNPGQVPVMSEFRVGSGFGYFPTEEMTDLQGDVLYTGAPSGKRLPSGTFLYEAAMDSSVGPFHWGEVGFYRNGVLFALGSQSTQIWKAATIGSMTGNQAVISAYLHPSSELSAAEVGNSSNELNVHVVPNIAQLPPAHLAFPNVVLVPSPITPTLGVLATASGRSWSLVGWDSMRFQGALVNATANTLTIGDDVPPPSVSGEYLISILSGPASGLVRSAVAYDAVAKRFTLDQPLPVTPLAGDTVRVMQSRIASSVENLPPVVWQLDPSLAASDINQLMDLDTFFSPLLRRDGSNGMLSALDMGGNKVFNLATPTLNTDAATKAYVDEQIVGFATQQDVEDAVSGLATESYVNSSIANLADQSYVSSEISAATAGLASESYVDSAVSTAVTGLATEAFATQAAADSIVGLASESYVDSAVSTARDAAELAQAGAEAARDAAFVAADVFEDTAAGLAGTSEGDQFLVVSDDGMTIYRYRHDAGPAATLVAEYPSKGAIDDLGIEAVTDEQDVAFSVVDDDGRRTWLESGKDGGPTEHAVEKLADAGFVVFGQSRDDLNDLSVSVVDADDRRTWLEADKAGRPTDRAAALMLEALEAGGFSPTPSAYKASYQASALKIVSGPDIVCWGDSMTAGAGGGGTKYSSVLQTLLANAGSNAIVRNGGVGGETSVTICARAGGNPLIIDVDGGEIPESGPVTVTLRSINGQIARPLLQGAGSMPGRLGDFPGTLSLVKPNGGSTWDPANYYQFTRAAAGDAIAADRPLPFYFNAGEERRGDIALIWIGQNGPSNTRAIEDARAIVEHMTALDKRYLVISRPTSTDAEDAAWFAAFGRRFVAIRKYMVEFGLADAGIEPTAQDLLDIAAGTVPSSLRNDAVHWTAAGYTVMGNVIFNRLKELGWI